MVIRTRCHSIAHCFIAMLIWLAAIHLNILLLLLSSFLFFSSSTHAALLIVGLLLVLMAIPLNENSKLGQAFARYVGRYVPGYFPMTLHIEETKAFNPNKSYVLALEPHSVFPLGSLSLLSITGLMPLAKTKGLVSSAVFYTPFLRQIATWSGLISATKENFVKYLETGHSCIIIPGGVHEVMYMNHEFEVAFLKQRHGFVQVAIETGSPLVPVFCFGQRNIYRWWKPKGKLYHHIARTLRFAPLVFWGAFGSPIPYRTPIHIVVGKPIQVRRNPKPTKVEVAEVHACFLSAIEKLFLKYRDVTGCKDLELKIL
ncbi:diacylglycerol O-acyltransferase 2D-like [Dioscorea cayenensis subsp. rotundata]|uniref:Acyltransferase n=1 Tax=Dioscorea cayennensis subsp. rotundata TaxID=55577 RepID=A0AB40B8I8_DIOCR|nr:diacylglycerol O-acyltransferase 2D-like [Dioscorea cayenensis subsp. rotundata]